jgi:3-deoxy-D-manno-octulosonic-acid transferase
MLFLYQIILTLIILLSPIIIIVRIYKNKEDKIRFKEKFGFPTKKRVEGKLIWLHGASVGEILSVIPLIENYEKDKSINQILITSSTLSSSKIIQKFKFKKTIHQFYPIDHIFFTRSFLKYWRPHVAIFIDSEIWPYMFKKLKENKISLVLLNARITKKTFSKWVKLKNFSRRVFDKITIAYPQNLETKSYLKKLKTNKIKTIGNIKFAEANNLQIDKINNKLKSQFKTKKIWIASSTHLGEEIFCAKAHIDLKKKIKNLITIIIPRHIHRVKKIIDELENLNLKVATHSSKNKNLKNIDIYIVDTFGETKKFHKIGLQFF